MTTTRILTAGLVLTALLFALATPAQADPTVVNVDGALAVPRTNGAPTHFGFAGKRPLDLKTDSGVARPTPAPQVEAKGFGFARMKPLRFKPDVVCPTPAPCLDGGPCSNGRCAPPVQWVPCEEKPAVREVAPAAADEAPVVRRRVVRRYVQPATTLMIDGRCTTGCGPCGPGLPPTRRIATDPLSIPTTFWSSGYHDGRNARCDPCPTVCDPCPTVCEPCAPRCDPCPPRRVVYRRVVPCPPRVYVNPCAPCGPRWGCGPCAPRYGCGPCGPGYAPAAAFGFGLGLALPLLACACL